MIDSSSLETSETDYFRTIKETTVLASKTFLIALSLISTFLARPTVAADWPQWLGPERNGISGETGLLPTWPETGPEVKWRTPLGKGFSSIAVSGDRLFTMYADTVGEFVVCLSAVNGKQLWRVKTGGYYKEGQGGDGPRSTPTVDGDRLYVLGAEGMLLALRTADGGEVWRKDLVAEFGGEIPRWGFSTSPLVEGDLVLVEAGGVVSNILLNMITEHSEEATAVALDKNTGTLVWSALDDKMSYSSPIAYTVDGVRQVAFFNAYALVGMAPADGKVLWRFPWKTRYDVSASTPVFLPPDRIFISGGDEGAVVRVGDKAVDQVWKNGTMVNHFSTSVYYDGHIYGFDQSILKCIDAETGVEKWKARGYAKGTLIIAGGDLIILGEQGNLGLAAATSEDFVEKANVPMMSGRCWTVPALSGGRLYIRDEQEIVAVDLRGPS